MSLNDTDIQHGGRTRAGKARRRALGAAAALGVMAAVPLSVNAAAGGLTKGQVLKPTKTTPAEVTKALKGDGPVVIGFLLPGITEDEIVQKRLDKIRKESQFRGTTFIVYRITDSTKLGDLPAQLGINYTPAVAVIRGDDKLSNVWRGLVDEDIIGQNLQDVKASAEAAKKARAKKAAASSGPATGDKAGIALAKKVNAAYKTVPALRMAGTMTLEGQPAEFDAISILEGGKVVRNSGSVSVGGVKLLGYGDSSGNYLQTPGKACWTKESKVDEEIGAELIALNRGGSVGKPSTKGSNFQMMFTRADEKSTFVIDRKTHLIKSVTFVDKNSKGTLTFTSLDKAPKAAKPSKIC